LASVLPSSSALLLSLLLCGDDTRTIRRTNTDPVRRVKAQRPSQPRKAAHVS
jgi:hypothetical protein